MLQEQQSCRNNVSVVRSSGTQNAQANKLLEPSGFRPQPNVAFRSEAVIFSPPALCRGLDGSCAYPMLFARDMRKDR